MAVDMQACRLSKMSDRQLMDELLDDLDPETLRALVGVRRAIKKAQRTQFTGRIEGDCQSGRVKRWRLPESFELYD